jgi:hypothetical protein
MLPVAKATLYTAILWLLVVLFLAVHHLIDRRDPKLALAPARPHALPFLDRTLLP